MESALCLVSIDGLCATALTDRTLDLPALRGLAARGARADGLRPSFPSVTWPCHTTLVTGVPPARHGVLGNHVYDRHRGELVSHHGDRSAMRPRAETLYEAAAAVGLSTAALCWPQTRGADCVRDNIPEFYEQDLFERHASRPLWDELRAAGLPIDRYGEWSAGYAHGPLQDWLTLEVTRHLVQRRPADVLLVHFLTVDSIQHVYGVNTPEARSALEYVDRLVGRLVDQLAECGRLETTNVVVLGDHGFTPVTHRALPNAELHQKGLLALDAGGVVCSRRVQVVSNGGAAHVYVAEGADHEALVHRARECFSDAPGVGLVLGAETFEDVGLPRPDEDPTQGDLVLVAADGWYFSDHVSPEAVAGAQVYRGMHGQLPDDPRLHAGFVAAGPGIEAGVSVGVMDHLDVAPTLAALLNLKLRAAQRPPIEAILRA